jgi:hypothetical protein
MRRRIRVSQWPHTIWVRLMNGALVMCSSSARISAEPIFSSQSLFGPFVNIIGQQSFYEVPTTHTGTSHYPPQRGIYIASAITPKSCLSSVLPTDDVSPYLNTIFSVALPAEGLIQYQRWCHSACHCFCKLLMYVRKATGFLIASMLGVPLDFSFL